MRPALKALSVQGEGEIFGLSLMMPRAESPPIQGIIKSEPRGYSDPKGRSLRILGISWTDDFKLNTLKW